jgi:hypothetical protein
MRCPRNWVLSLSDSEVSRIQVLVNRELTAMTVVELRMHERDASRFLLSN